MGTNHRLSIRSVPWIEKYARSPNEGNNHAITFLFLFFFVLVRDLIESFYAFLYLNKFYKKYKDKLCIGVVTDWNWGVSPPILIPLVGGCDCNIFILINIPRTINKYVVTKHRFSIIDQFLELKNMLAILMEAIVVLFCIIYTRT